MHAIGSNRSSNAGAVIPYYIAAAISFLFACTALLISGNSFFGHYFQPHLLAITHLMVLGWGTMTIFGALHQFLPVLLDVELYSERLAKITFYLFAAGILLLVYSFWFFEVGIPLQASSVILFIAVSLFSYNIHKTAKAANNQSIAADFITTSLLWLILTVMAGVLLVFNFRFLFLPESHLVYLKLHAHLGIAGWFLLLITGVSSRLIPMFLLSPQMNHKALSWVYYLVNIGLAGYAADVLILKGSYFGSACAILIVSGIVTYLVNVRSAYKARVRKGLDAGMRESLLAFAALGIPLILLMILIIAGEEETKMLPFFIAYGFSILFGFISTLILGQVYKTLPFIIWLNLRERNKEIKILPRDLFSDKLVKYQMILHLTGTFLAISGLLLEFKIGFFIGGSAILLSAILFNINLFKMLYHLIAKVK